MLTEFFAVAKRKFTTLQAISRPFQKRIFCLILPLLISNLNRFFMPTAFVSTPQEEPTLYEQQMERLMQDLQEDYEQLLKQTFFNNRQPLNQLNLRKLRDLTHRINEHCSALLAYRQKIEHLKK